MTKQINGIPITRYQFATTFDWAGWTDLILVSFLCKSVTQCKPFDHSIVCNFDAWLSRVYSSWFCEIASHLSQAERMIKLYWIWCDMCANILQKDDAFYGPTRRKNAMMPLIMVSRIKCTIADLDQPHHWVKKRMNYRISFSGPRWDESHIRKCEYMMIILDGWLSL